MTYGQALEKYIRDKGIDPYSLSQEQLEREAKKFSEINGQESGLTKGWNWLSDTISKTWKGLTGQTSAQATIDANKMNIENQNYWNQIAMEREDSAHQREVADLQAAGLNPWLSAGGGGSNAAALSTAQAEPADGSKILQATSALALMAVVKLLSRSTSRTSTIIKK